jgi:formylglycine-generating enzyme required for sulfatase activity
MGSKIRRTLLTLNLALASVLSVHAQLLPQVNSPPAKPAAPKAAQIVIQTSPNAQIYLDDVFKGQASPQGRLVIEKAVPGDHALRISLPRKQSFEQKVTVTAGQAANVTAVLADLGGTVVVQTSPGAAVFLDSASRGTTDAKGRLAIPDVAASAHELRVTALGKKEYRQSITVAAGKEFDVAAPLADLPGTVVVQTSPGAAVFLDDSSRGTADAGGQLAIPAVAAGSHQLRVTAAGKADFQQSITVAAGQEARVAAPLADLAGTLVVQTSPGAAVFLDDSSRGATDASGKLSIPDVAAGSHALRISAPGKKDYRQSIAVSAGQEAKVEASLVYLAPTTGSVRINPKDGLKYVWIPPGSFQMGCSPGDSECGDNEKPPHPVTITKGFWLGQTEVTVGAYKRFATATFRKMPSAPGFNPGWANDHMPIVEVNWDNADNYCRWAGGRLPTEAEWEYAARGGSAEARYGSLDDVAWYKDNSGDQAHPVGQQRANAFALYDMLGNVAEWLNDRYDEKYYHSSPAQDPAGPASGKLRVIRGLGWDDAPMTVRVSQRQFSDPAGRLTDVGFRCGGDIFPP